MSDAQATPAEALYQRLLNLQTEAARTQWRGLCIIRCASTVCFKWPTQALVLGTELKAYRQYLGTSQSTLVLDMRAQIHADALAATLPTVHAQGLAILLLPLEPSPFALRLLHMLPQSALCQAVALDPEAGQGTFDFSHLPVPPAPRLITSPPVLNEEQQAAFNQLIKPRAGPALINAARGRGKSTLLGVLAAAFAEQGEKVWLCAPSKRQAATLLGAAYGHDTGRKPPAIRFIAADKLLAEDSPKVAGIVIVDEAARLPRHMLDTLVQRYPEVIMATTSEGYETCGRGFLLKFQQQLAASFSEFLLLHLEQPFRFAAHCPLELWLHQALLLSPASSDVGACAADNTPQAATAVSGAAALHYEEVHASALDHATLAIAFQLLMDAHYQTSPNDLKLLLDDFTQTLVLQWQQYSSERRLTAVAWLSREGELDTELAQAVVAGSRRPPGNLLAQSLARHVQDPAPAVASWLRIVRIAVRSDLQQQGLGSALLIQITTDAGSTSLAGVGSSFASAPAINRFWRNHGFLPVRLGSRKDSTTGRYALLMLMPLNNSWSLSINRWADFFSIESSALVTLLKLQPEFMASLQLPAPAAAARSLYRPWAERRVAAFAEGALDVESVRASLLTRYPKDVSTQPLLSLAVYNPILSETDKQRLQLSGRKALTRKVREICLQLTGKL